MAGHSEWLFGYIVTSMAPNSPAAAANMQVNDRIVSIADGVRAARPEPY